MILIDLQDFDIAGTYDAMLPDAECVKVVSDILNNLEIGDFVIKLNHRQLLDGMFEACGVPADKFRTICSTVDKLDKVNSIGLIDSINWWMSIKTVWVFSLYLQSPWADVRREMIEEKGLDEVVADKIGEYVQLNGNTELVDELLKNEHLTKVPAAVAGLEAIKLLLNYCNILGLQKEILFDLSLARGLDYYTGVIYEAVLTGNLNRTSFSLSFEMSSDF